MLHALTGLSDCFANSIPFLSMTRKQKRYFGNVKVIVKLLLISVVRFQLNWERTLPTAEHLSQIWWHILPNALLRWILDVLSPITWLTADPDKSGKAGERFLPPRDFISSHKCKLWPRKGSHCFYRRKNKKDKEDNLIFFNFYFPQSCGPVEI